MRNLVLFIGIALIASSCFDAPQFTDTPKITFKNIIFKDLTSGQDSLILFIDFEDGDGDLGLDPKIIGYEDRLKIYYSNKNGQELDFLNRQVEVSEILKYSDRSFVDTLPEYSGNAICLNWDTNPDLTIVDNANDTSYQLQDTLYFKFNPRYHNILVDYYVDRGGGFKLYDWRLEGDCSVVQHGRFPILNVDGKARPLEGTIKYGMISFGFKNIFGNDLMKLEVTIIDQSGKYSNTITTPPFRLSEID